MTDADSLYEQADFLVKQRKERGPDPKPEKRVLRRNQPRPDRLWRERVLERDQGCVVHADPKDCDEGWQAHHVVAQQELRRTAPAELWNVLVGMGVCGLAHRQHHSRIAPIPRQAIPVEVDVFLQRLGFHNYLVRHYPLMEDAA
jgi:hypothetical protein